MRPRILLSLVLPLAFLAACSAAPAGSVTPTAADHTKGAANAKVTLIEYGDFQCPACGYFHPIVEQVMARYGDRISFTFRNFPLEQLHKNAMAASQAAEAAGAQGKYWEMYDKLYDTQKAWSDLDDATETFAGYAKDLGLDVEKFKSELTSKKYESKVRADYQGGVTLGVNSTPSFYLNGTKIQSNPQSYGGFQALIDSALQAAGTQASPSASPMAASSAAK